MAPIASCDTIDAYSSSSGSSSDSESSDEEDTDNTNRIEQQVASLLGEEATPESPTKTENSASSLETIVPVRSHAASSSLSIDFEDIHCSDFNEDSYSSIDSQTTSPTPTLIDQPAKESETAESESDATVTSTTTTLLTSTTHTTFNSVKSSVRSSVSSSTTAKILVS